MNNRDFLLQAITNSVGRLEKLQELEAPPGVLEGELNIIATRTEQLRAEMGCQERQSVDKAALLRVVRYLDLDVGTSKEFHEAFDKMRLSFTAEEIAGG